MTPLSANAPPILLSPSSDSRPLPVIDLLIYRLIIDLLWTGGLVSLYRSMDQSRPMAFSIIFKILKFQISRQFQVVVFAGQSRSSLLELYTFVQNGFPVVVLQVNYTFQDTLKMLRTCTFLIKTMINFQHIIFTKNSQIKFAISCVLIIN